MTATSTPRLEEGGIRQRQREETSATIEDAALELFAEYGFDSVTADEIANAASVARRTVFRYFPGGKEEILLKDLRRRMDDLSEELAARPPHESALDALRHSLMAWAESYEGEREIAQMRAAILENAPSLQARAMGEQIRLTDALIHMVALRLAADPATDLRPGIIVSASLSASMVALGSWLSPSNKQPLRDLLGEALDLVNMGLDKLGSRLSPVVSSPATRRKRK
jgi:AcrR family transcriptional regulator